MLPCYSLHLSHLLRTQFEWRSDSDFNSRILSVRDSPHTHSPPPAHRHKDHSLQRAPLCALETRLYKVGQGMPSCELGSHNHRFLGACRPLTQQTCPGHGTDPPWPWKDAHERTRSCQSCQHSGCWAHSRWLFTSPCAQPALLRQLWPALPILLLLAGPGGIRKVEWLMDAGRKMDSSVLNMERF